MGGDVQTCVIKTFLATAEDIHALGMLYEEEGKKKLVMCIKADESYRCCYTEEDTDKTYDALINALKGLKFEVTELEGESCLVEV